MIQQDYLQNLDATTLDNLQTSVLKARFKDSNIDREGSFLHYFHQNLDRYIAEPYRDDATCEINYESVEDLGLIIFDKITYTCRKAGTEIQKSIRWQTDPDEFLKVLAVRMSVKYPYHHEKKGNTQAIYDSTQDEKFQNDPTKI